jgi:GT2 family glycosyltransferase
MIASAAFVMTCFNRRAKTLACLESLLANPEIASRAIDYHVFLCDDGSKDGTGAAVAALLGERVTVVVGTGNLFWNGGMVKALGGVDAGRYDAILLVNDDIRFAPDAISRLNAADAATRSAAGRPAVLVGAMVGTGGTTSYGGFKQGPWWNRLRLSRIDPGSAPVPIDTFNCNLVWIPKEVATTTTLLDPAFIHSMGDIDLGFRLRRHGIPMFLCAGHVGHCDSNPPAVREVSLISRLNRASSPKQYPLRPWFVLTWRHAGILWPLVMISPYAAAVFGGQRRRGGSAGQ